MDVAIIKDKVCINVLVFEDIETAKQFLTDGLLDDNPDTVVEVELGYGIGDFYDGVMWEKTPQPEETPEEELARLKSEISAFNIEEIQLKIDRINELMNK